MSKPNVIIYRDELLGGSETFILSQAESLTAFRPVYVGIKRVSGLEIPRDRSLLMASGCCIRLKTAKLKLLGPWASHVAQLRGLRPALMHAHFGMDAVHAMPLARALNVPMVVTFHGFDATVHDHILQRESVPLNLYVRRRPELARTAARVLCVSEFIRGRVLSMGFPPDRTMVHYTGIDLRKFSNEGQMPRKPVVLFAGRLVEKKGCEFLIRAMHKVQARMESVELVVIGDGPLRNKLEQQARENLRSVRFLGRCSPLMVRAWLRAACVFSTPSVIAESGDAEGFGMVFAEAQAMGVPVASFATGGIPEAVEHGVTGLLAPERDCDALANNIVALLTNHSMWQRFSAAGQERVKRLFDLDKQAAKLEKVYQEIVKEHQSIQEIAS